MLLLTRELSLCYQVRDIYVSEAYIVLDLSFDDEYFLFIMFTSSPEHKTSRLCLFYVYYVLMMNMILMMKILLICLNLILFANIVGLCLKISLDYNLPIQTHEYLFSYKMFL